MELIKVVLLLIGIAIIVFISPIKHHKPDTHFKPLKSIVDIKKQLFNLPLKDNKKVAVIDSQGSETVSINRSCDGINPMDFSQHERNLICSTIYSESSDEPYRAKVLTCVVLLKRLQNGGYGQTIKDVIFANHGRAFNGTWSDSFGKFGQDEISAFMEACATINDYPDGLLYFANVDMSTDKDFIRNVILKGKYEKVGNTTFSLKR
jgi:hypothetical protein